MPNLILLNGPLGSGKSTLAQCYVDHHPLAINLDIDDVRRHYGQWREQAARSSVLSKDLARVIARHHLQQGYDVIVPQQFCDGSELAKFAQIATDESAKLVEIIIDLTKTESTNWFMARGGFHTGGLLEAAGIPGLERRFTAMHDIARLRPDLRRLKPIRNDIPATYNRLQMIINY